MGCPSSTMAFTGLAFRDLKKGLVFDLSMDQIAHGGLPGRTRTCDPQLRRLVLYPVELRAVNSLDFGRKAAR
jgi:hypothetical protein